MEKIEKGHSLTQSADIYKENIDTLKKLFPTIVKEGKIDLEELKALLDDELETNDEYYRFTWAGKNEARREANKPSTATLRPNKADSKNWDITNNIFIEGDNLEVLKLMQKSYAGKIKMMYFDPPYNTGNDFVYKDNYADNLSNYLSLTSQSDDEGKKLNTNAESDGRYHSNWLNMMYPRLKLARNLLTEDGVIFISIDDNEATNLRKLCDEIFGADNLIETIIWKNKYGAGAATRGFISVHEYILCYSKCPIKNIQGPLSEDEVKKHTKKDSKFHIRGPYRTQPVQTNSLGDRPNLVYPIIYKGHEIWPNKQWVWSKDRMETSIANDDVEISEKDGVYSIRSKQYLNDEFGNLRKGKPTSLLNGPFTQEGTAEIREIFELDVFQFPKPSALIKYLIGLVVNDVDENDYIVLDIFAGSGSTANAVLNLNGSDNGCRKFICIQLPEKADEKSEAFKAGYANIAEITKERIRRAGTKIISDKTAELEKLKQSIEGKIFQEDIQAQIDNLQSTINNLDTGFKAFKLESSNMNTWDGSIENFEVNLFNAEHNIKDDRTEEDVLFEILLKYGIDLTVPIEEKEVGSCRVYSIGGGVLFVCLSNNITTSIAEAIGKWKTELQPAKCRVLFKDNGFKDDVAKTNSIQILRQFGIEETNSI